MKTRKIVLLSANAVLFVIAVVQLILNLQNPVKILKIKDDVSEVKIEKAENNLVVAKNGEDWLVGEENYPGNESSCDALASKAGKVKILGKVVKGSNDEILSKYGLADEQKTTVTVSGAKGILRTLYIGKVSSTGSQTYIMYDNNKAIYLAAGNLTRDFGLDVNDYRSKVVFEVNKDDITSVDVKNQNGSFTMTRSSDGTVFEIPGSSVDIDPEKASKWFSENATFTTTEWIYDTDSLNGEPDSTIRINLPEKSITVTCYKNSDDSYYGKTSENDYVFKIASYLYPKYEKTPEDFAK